MQRDVAISRTRRTRTGRAPGAAVLVKTRPASASGEGGLPGGLGVLVGMLGRGASLYTAG